MFWFCKKEYYIQWECAFRPHNLRFFSTWLFYYSCSLFIFLLIDKKLSKQRAELVHWQRLGELNLPLWEYAQPMVTISKKKQKICFLIRIQEKISNNVSFFLAFFFFQINHMCLWWSGSVLKFTSDGNCICHVYIYDIHIHIHIYMTYTYTYI